MVPKLYRLGFRVLLFGGIAMLLFVALAGPLKQNKTAAQVQNNPFGSTSQPALSEEAAEAGTLARLDPLASLEWLESNAPNSQHDPIDSKAQLWERRRQASLSKHFQNGPLVAPSNDLCVGAEIISGNGPFPVFTAVTPDITDATTTSDPPLPACQNNVSRSIWYSLTPAVTASYDISSCASGGTVTTVDDTVIAIYSSSNGNCGGTFTQLPGACDDDGCVTEALQSVVPNVKLIGGTTYFILVWQFDVPPPTSGNTAVQLRIDRTLPPANDTCGGATPLSINVPLTGTTQAASNDYQTAGTTCFTGLGQTPSTATGREVVYSFTAPTTDTFSFKVKDYNALGNLVLYASANCPSATPGTPLSLTCDNVTGPGFAASNRTSGSTAEEIMCVALSAGQQVFIFVDDNNAEASFAGSPFVIEASVCVRESEPNNTPATANSFGSQAFGIEGSVGSAADVDFYSLGNLSAGARVFAMIDSAAANSSDFDMRVTSTVDTLEYDDLNADTLFGSLGPAIGGTIIPTGGLIFLRVNHNSANSVAEPYRLFYNVQPAGANPLPSCSFLTTSASTEIEPNNTAAQANAAVNNYFSGSLSGPAPSTDVDVFSFTAFAGQFVFISFDGDPCRDNSPIDGQIQLLGTDGNAVLASVNDGGSTSNTSSGAGSLTATTPNSPSEGLVLRIPSSGTYFARVSVGTTSSSSIGAGDYLVSIVTLTPSAASGIISGRILTTAGVPVSGTVVNLSGSQTRRTITDENGNYRFDGVAVSGFYTVIPSRANFVFSPSTRSFNQLTERTDATFSGQSLGEAVNPVDTTEYFIRQQYLDVLGREPDEGGLNYWSDQILGCGSNADCVSTRRHEVAAAFFMEAEFQRTGSFLYALYKGGLGRQPLYQEFSSDRRQLVDGTNLELAKQIFTQAFVTRAEFLARYDAYMTAESFVDALVRTVQQASRVDLSAHRAEFIRSYNAGATLIDSRGRALRAMAEVEAFRQAEYNSAFVLTEYFAYLHRDPDVAGYDSWLEVLNNRTPGNYQSMVCAFVTSTEYQQRFGVNVTRSNRDCGQ